MNTDERQCYWIGVFHGVFYTLGCAFIVLCYLAYRKLTAMS